MENSLNGSVLNCLIHFHEQKTLIDRDFFATRILKVVFIEKTYLVTNFVKFLLTRHREDAANIYPP